MKAIVLDIGKVSISNKPVLNGIPDGIYVEYFGKLPDGEKFIIMRPVEDWDYDSFVCLVGAESDFRSIEILRVERFRDGGTTKVKTSEGDFYFPSRFKEFEKATFNGLAIEMYEWHTA